MFYVTGSLYMYQDQLDIKMFYVTGSLYMYQDQLDIKIN